MIRLSKTRRIILAMILAFLKILKLAVIIVLIAGGWWLALNHTLTFSVTSLVTLFLILAYLEYDDIKK